MLHVLKVMEKHAARTKGIDKHAAHAKGMDKHVARATGNGGTCCTC